MSYLRHALEEDPEDSCRALIHLLQSRDISQRDLIIRDFASKLTKVRSKAKLQFAIDMLLQYAPKEIQSFIKNEIRPQVTPKPRGDIAIVTIKPIELVAAKTALGIKLDEDENARAEGYRFWLRKVENTDDRRVQSILLTMVGTAGTLNCANACRTIANNFDVSLFIMTGMAAGVRDKIGLGDVICAETVIDYEAARKEPRRKLVSPATFNVAPILRRDIHYFLANQGRWFNGLSASLTQLGESIKLPNDLVGWQPVLQTGVLLTGAKLVADGSIPKMRVKYHEHTRALDMEGSGLASACEEIGIPWAIFKGVSDFGDSKSKDASETGEEQKDIWQLPAALVATIAAMNFIKSDYRKGQ